MPSSEGGMMRQGRDSKRAFRDGVLNALPLLKAIVAPIQVVSKLGVVLKPD